jgi:hypothetical protein
MFFKAFLLNCLPVCSAKYTHIQKEARYNAGYKNPRSSHYKEARGLPDTMQTTCMFSKASLYVVNSRSADLPKEA